MKINILALVAFCIASASHVNSLAQVRLVLSAALSNNYYEFRKGQYIETFGILANLGYQNPYVIEAIKKEGPTFLDEYTTNAFYSSANIPGLRNYGINEARTMLDGLTHFNFDDEDMIIKLTGRYQPTSDSFLKLVEQNPDVDAFVKVDQWGNVFTLGFAMRCKNMKEMYSSMDYSAMEHHMINVETEVGNYVRRKQTEGTLKIMYVNKLDLKANLYGSSSGINHNEFASW
ncbi:MAG: hypothetical protein NTX86_01235 [Candidatus Dependentiae bacterium]|nr:hypothetical protein [Candidatus Dependentiae bacterium]